MIESLESLKKLIDECSEEGRKALAAYLKASIPGHPLEEEWGINASTILSAIARSSDLTKRGVRGIIAEAVFETDVLPTVSASGWMSGATPPGDWPYDALLVRAGVSIRIQIKLQRLEKSVPKYYPEDLFVVEVQKTRSGQRRTREVKVAGVKAESTRPYRFGDFDILAVNMHPATHQWNNFRYTVADWLLPRAANTSLIEVFQPVSLVANDVWTDNLATCIEWFLSKEKKQILQLRHTPHSRKTVSGI